MKQNIINSQNSNNTGFQDFFISYLRDLSNLQNIKFLPALLSILKETNLSKASYYKSKGRLVEAQNIQFKKVNLGYFCEV